jgi:hypothetical protein
VPLLGQLLHTRPSPPAAALDPADLLPPSEEMAPDSPTEAIGRYVALLMRWNVLSRRQLAYEQECTTLHAVGTALQADWAEVQAEHTARLAELETTPLSRAAALREA